MKVCRRPENGQALIVVAFAIITLIAFVGLGVDLGLAYVERVRVQRAADAAALAAAAELPLEAPAQLRALEYLAENDYDCMLVAAGAGANCTNPDVHVRINSNENFVNDPENPVPTNIEIDTAEFSQTQGNNPVPNTAVRIRVRVTQLVPVYFMRLLGFKPVPVTGVATAENIRDLDIVLVFDQSGSMEFDTLCYGCWTPQVGAAYPQGNRYPLPWGGTMYGPPTHSSGNDTQPVTISGKKYYYMAIEAEEYSKLSNDYHKATRPGQGYTFWVLGRNGKVNDPTAGYLGDSGAFGRDDQGGYLMHAPYVGYTNQKGASGVGCSWADLNNGRMCLRNTWITEHGGPYPAPRADYNLRLKGAAPAGTWYIWVRVQGGDTSDDLSGQGLFWGLSGGAYSGAPLGRAATTPQASGDNGWHYNGAESSSWRWRRLVNSSGGAYNPALSAGVDYTLHLWAGSAGYAVDRIIITNYNGEIKANLGKAANSVNLDNNRGGWAADPCDARFGGFPGGEGEGGPTNDLPRCDATSGPALSPEARYRYNDDLFDDEQPLASTAASAVRFIRKLDPAFDQIGLVRYSQKAEPARELLCLKSQGAGCTKNVMDNTMLDELMTRQKTYANGSTNIPDGLEEAIKMLDLDPPHNGRATAAHIIILMTDGQPNEYGNLDNANKDCYQEDLWPGSDRALDCSMYMARRALNKGIVVFTITLGEGADQELLEEIANMTGGMHLHAESPDRLDDIFDELYSRIFLRLVE